MVTVRMPDSRVFELGLPIRPGRTPYGPVTLMVVRRGRSVGSGRLEGGIIGGSDGPLG